MNNTRQYADFRACSNIKPALFRDDLPKTGNYTTPEEIDEMRELQQVTATGRGNAKRCRFYRVELLNGGRRRGGGYRRRKKGKRVTC